MQPEWQGGHLLVHLRENRSRLLRDGYKSYQGGVRQICRESSAPDFRAKARIKLGETPGLEKVNEAGEFKRGTMKEAKETYSLATFGKIFGISRQALINDDLGAFADLTVRLGRSAAEFLAKLGIVEEEIDESLFWLELLVETGIVQRDVLADLLAEANEITAMVVASIRTAKAAQQPVRTR